MKKCYIIDIFKSNYCKFVFALSLLVSYFLVPDKIFYRYYSILGILFILTTSFTITCIVRIVKEKIISARSTGTSLLGIISTLIGVGALQACTIGAPLCGATIGSGILALIFPGFAFNFIQEYAIPIVIVSMLLQILSLYLMKCFYPCKSSTLHEIKLK